MTYPARRLTGRGFFDDAPETAFLQRSGCANFGIISVRGIIDVTQTLENSGGCRPDRPALFRPGAGGPMWRYRQWFRGLEGRFRQRSQARGHRQARIAGFGRRALCHPHHCRRPQSEKLQVFARQIHEGPRPRSSRRGASAKRETRHSTPRSNGNMACLPVCFWRFTGWKRPLAVSWATARSYRQSSR